MEQQNKRKDHIIRYPRYAFINTQTYRWQFALGRSCFFFRRRQRSFSSSLETLADAGHRACCCSNGPDQALRSGRADIAIPFLYFASAFFVGVTEKRWHPTAGHIVI